MNSCTKLRQAIREFCNVPEELIRQVYAKVQALNAGFTLTNFHNKEEFQDVEKKYPKMFVMTTEKLVDKSLAALDNNKVIYIPGFANKLLVSFRFVFLPILRRSLKSAPSPV